jgi:hypothetical protein
MVNPDYTRSIGRSEAAGNRFCRIVFYSVTSLGRLTQIVRISWFGVVVLNLSFFYKGEYQGK